MTPLAKHFRSGGIPLMAEAIAELIEAVCELDPGHLPPLMWIDPLQRRAAEAQPESTLLGFCSAHNRLTGEKPCLECQPKPSTEEIQVAMRRAQDDYICECGHRLGNHGTVPGDPVFCHSLIGKRADSWCQCVMVRIREPELTRDYESEIWSADTGEDGDSVTLELTRARQQLGEVEAELTLARKALIGIINGLNNGSKVGDVTSTAFLAQGQLEVLRHVGDLKRRVQHLTEQRDDHIAHYEQEQRHHEETKAYRQHAEKLLGEAYNTIVELAADRDTIKAAADFHAEPAPVAEGEREIVVGSTWRVRDDSFMAGYTLKVTGFNPNNSWIKTQGVDCSLTSEFNPRFWYEKCEWISDPDPEREWTPEERDAYYQSLGKEADDRLVAGLEPKP